MKLYSGNNRGVLMTAKYANLNRRDSRNCGLAKSFSNFQAKLVKRTMRHEGKLTGVNQWAEFASNQQEYQWDNKYSTFNFHSLHETSFNGQTYKWANLQKG